jgi:hypothetical protein
MAPIESISDVDDLRRRVRANQHVRSIPLFVLGALLANYGVTGFAPQPVSWRYGAALSFVLIWLLGKTNETVSGVGPAQADYLIGAGFVFSATNLALLVQRFQQGAYVHELFGVWIAIVGITVAVLAIRSRDGVVLAAAVLVTALGLVMVVIGSADLMLMNNGVSFITQNWSMTLVALVGGVLTLLGLVVYLRERRVA